MLLAIAKQQDSKRRRNDERDDKRGHRCQHIGRGERPGEGVRYSANGQHRRQNQNRHHQADEQRPPPGRYEIAHD
jgi:hypothetical protein